jgi:hypothetical protein
VAILNGQAFDEAEEHRVDTHRRCHGEVNHTFPPTARAL